MNKPLASLMTVAALMIAGSASAARVKPVSVDASSSYPPENGASYDAKKANDGKAATAWIEGDEGSGLGSWLKMSVPPGTKLTGIKMWAGYWYSYDFWTRANRPKTVEVKFSDGSTEMLDLTDKMEAQVLKFAKPHDTSEIRIRVKAIYNGNTWFDTAISEVQLMDGNDDGFATAKGFAISSKLPDDGDGNYNPANVADGVTDSMWCEGSKDGDGTGEWVEVEFGTSRSVSKVSLVNGVGGNLGAWMKSNRATKATLTFSDGSTQSIDVKNSFTNQSISFPSKTTSKVRLTVDEVYKGKEYNDLCISEMYFE
ncbi:MAG: discoidin domain-containing protein [Myxococcota bacterium]